MDTASNHADTILNAKKGPCKALYEQDLNAWGQKNEPLFKYTYRPLLTKLSSICGFDYFSLKTNDPDGAFGGMPLSWALQAVSDAFKFAKYEGMDITLGGQLDPKDLE